MRKRISDENIFPAFSLESEYKKLHQLFLDKSAFARILGVSAHSRPCLSYDDCLQIMFLDWKLRGSFTSLEEMLYSLQISEDDFDKDVTEDRLLDYIQFTINALLFVETAVKSGKYSICKANSSIFSAIYDNSNLILEHLGAEYANASNKEICVVYKDDVADAVALLHENMRVSITEYLKIDNRGDLSRKGEVLCTLSKELERYEKRFKGTEFEKICSDTTFLLNKSGIRHYQNPDNKIDAQFLKMDVDELEKWYDRSFRMILACISLLPHLDFKGDIKKIRST